MVTKWVKCYIGMTVYSGYGMGFYVHINFGQTTRQILSMRLILSRKLT